MAGSLSRPSSLLKICLISPSSVLYRSEDLVRRTLERRQTLTDLSGALVYGGIAVASQFFAQDLFDIAQQRVVQIGRPCSTHSRTPSDADRSVRRFGVWRDRCRVPVLCSRSV